MIRSIASALLVASFLGYTSCDGGAKDGPGAAPGSGTTGSGTLEIAVIPKGTTHDFWKMIEAGARKAEAELNAAAAGAVKVHWQGPLREDNTKAQIDLVKTFISRGIHGMCLAPNDKSALVRAVRDVTGAGIPVVVFDSGLDAEVGKDFVSYIATDNYQGGVLGARRLAETLGGKGRVVLLRYMVGSESTTQRESGFVETLAKEFPEIELISDDQYAGATEELAFKTSQNVLTRFRDQVEGIFCPNESAASGMLEALRRAELVKKVKFVGFDSSEKLLGGLRAGELHGLVLQNPIKMGYESVRAVVRHLRKETIPPSVDTGVTVATPDNVDSPEMTALHSPAI